MWDMKNHADLLRDMIKQNKEIIELLKVIAYEAEQRHGN